MSTMAATGREPKGTYQDATREMNGWTARAEKRLLLRASRPRAGRTASRRTTSRSSACAGMLLTGAAYARSRPPRGPPALASLGLLLNWFGDSLDGIARAPSREAAAPVRGSTSTT